MTSPWTAFLRRKKKPEDGSGDPSGADGEIKACACGYSNSRDCPTCNPDLDRGDDGIYTGGLLGMSSSSGGGASRAYANPYTWESDPIDRAMHNTALVRNDWRNNPVYLGRDNYEADKPLPLMALMDENDTEDAVIQAAQQPVQAAWYASLMKNEVPKLPFPFLYSTPVNAANLKLLFSHNPDLPLAELVRDLGEHEPLVFDMPAEAIASHLGPGFRMTQPDSFHLAPQGMQLTVNSNFTLPVLVQLVTNVPTTHRQRHGSVEQHWFQGPVSNLVPRMGKGADSTPAFTGVHVAGGVDPHQMHEHKDLDAFIPNPGCINDLTFNRFKAVSIPHLKESLKRMLSRSSTSGGGGAEYYDVLIPSEESPVFDNIIQWMAVSNLPLCIDKIRLVKTQDPSLSSTDIATWHPYRDADQNMIFKSPEGRNIARVPKPFVMALVAQVEEAQSAHRLMSVGGTVRLHVYPATKTGWKTVTTRQHDKFVAQPSAHFCAEVNIRFCPVTAIPCDMANAQCPLLLGTTPHDSNEMWALLRDTYN